MREFGYRAFGILALLGAMGLSACTSSGGNQVESVLTPLSTDPQQTAAAAPAQEEVLDPRAYCPKTVMRAGTQTLDIFPPKMKADDPERAKKLRFRATITEVVRECNYAGSMLNMKVGIAGRVISGPSGETGPVPLPVRVAVARGDELLYSVLHEIPADIPVGRTNTTFSFVDPAVSFAKPDRENIIIYVGFDEMGDTPGTAAQARKPIN